MPRVTIADQIECLEQILEETTDRPGRSQLLIATIRSLKELDYQHLELKRRARRERKIEQALAQPSE